MRFSTVLCAVGAFAAAVFAQQNPISKPGPSDEIIAGKPFSIQWKPTTKGTITLRLRQGESTNLDTIGDIATDIENTGTYEWTPEETLPAGDDYAIEIVSEDKEVNYTSLLTIKSAVTSKPKKSSTIASATATTKEAAESSEYPSKTMTSDVPHTTMASNGTFATSTLYSNNTASSTRGSTRPSGTKESSVPSVPADSGAIGVIRSPLALVACLVGAIVYFN